MLKNPTNEWPNRKKRVNLFLEKSGWPVRNLKYSIFTKPQCKVKDIYLKDLKANAHKNTSPFQKRGLREH